MGFLGLMVSCARCLRPMPKFGPVVGCGAGDVVPSCQAVLSRFRCFSVVGSSSKLQLRTCEACGVVGRKPLRWAMKPGECVTLRGHHDDRIMHQAGVTNALRDGVRLKLIQLLGKPGHINDDKSERTCYLPWLFLSSENSHVR